MNLVLTARARLRAVYGERDARRVFTALAQLREARAAAGIPSELLFVEDGLPALGLPAASADAPAIAAQLSQAARSLEHTGQRLASVLLVGGPEIVPFHEAPNPTPYDGDPSVPTDKLYAARSPSTLFPEWPVGRLPGAAGPNPELLLRALHNATELHRRPRRRPRKSFGYATAAWSQASASVYGEISPELPILSPPVVATSLDRTQLQGAGVVYCNLHGVRDGPFWYGQADGANGLLVALRPEDLRGVELSGALVLSEACYGAAIAGRTEQTSLALAFLAQGAGCFVGATAMAYGPARSPLSEADLIGQYFLRAVRAGGTVGAAFLAAQTGMLRETLRRHRALDDDDRKTVLEFVLYGDPTLPV